jgi:hypothetical protein
MKRGEKDMNLIWYSVHPVPQTLADYSVIETGDLRNKRIVEKPDPKGLSTFSWSLPGK